ncbi:hypothetical protein [Konateibacter massiliensis]|uniref:hypothetical protein n=1 Tax=Konateibacter massiliensis TaxID=2002841 RepID=UPI000C157FF0|nr:hypothetical protein [Konateibacter massiliensis]
MSIRPFEINGAISRAQDIGAIKQNEDNKHMVNQNNFHDHAKKEIDHHQKAVRTADDSDNYQKKYDAKEKGNGSYFSNPNQKKGSKKEQESGKKNEKSRGFDVSI